MRKRDLDYACGEIKLNKAFWYFDFWPKIGRLLDLLWRWKFPRVGSIVIPLEQDIKVTFCTVSGQTPKMLICGFRRCAQARAIENECYVAIAASVRLYLPQVDNWIFSMVNSPRYLKNPQGLCFFTWCYRILKPHRILKWRLCRWFRLVGQI